MLKTIPDALIFTAIVISITRIEDFAQKAHAMQDELKLVLKFGTKGHVIDSVTLLKTSTINPDGSLKIPKNC